MATPSNRTISNRDARNQPQRKTRHGGSGNNNQPLPKKNQKPMKSNITNKMKPKRPNGPSATGTKQGDDDDDGGGGTFQDAPDSDEDPDVLTLPDAARVPGVGEDTPRLAGFQMNDDRDMFTDMITLDGDDDDAAPCSEDDYADVENVSDGDESEDEDDVLRSAEKDLIEEFERAEQHHNANIVTLDMHDMAIDDDDIFTQHLGLQSTGARLDDFGFAVNMNEDPFFGLTRDDSLYNDMWNEAESAIWRMPETIRSRENSDPNSIQKRVRFEEKKVSESNSSSSEDPDDAFPDLFTASDAAVVKQHLALGLEQDLDFKNGMDDAESFYDFEDEDEKFAFELDEESDSDDESSNSDSDDEGDTTDEESREEQIARLEERKRAAGKPAKSPPSTPVMANRAISTASTPSASRPTTPRNGRGPKTGTFAIDPTRAAMTTDANGKRIKLLPPSQPPAKDKAFWERAKTANSSRTNTPPTSAYLTMPSPVAEDDPPPRPLTAKSTLGSMFNGDIEVIRNHDISGIAEDLFPAMLSQTSFNGTPTDDSETDQHDINMQDYLDMDDSDSESDCPPSAPIASPTGQDMYERRNSLTNGLLDHFDQRRGVVGSFRRNQHTAKHFSSLASHPGKRASTHEFNALQKGKRGAANTPMTPARKKRASQDFGANGAGIRKSAGNPLGSRRPRSRGNSVGGMHHADLFQTLARNPFE